MEPKITYNTTDFTPYDSDAPVMEHVYVTTQSGDLVFFRIVKISFCKNEKYPGKYRVYWTREMTDEEIEVELIRANIEPWKNWRRGSPEESNFDHDYIAAIEDIDGKLQVNMQKAKAIHMDRVRYHRNEKLENLDREWIIESSKGDKSKVDTVIAKKKTLRDLPNTFSNAHAETLEELKLLWPKELYDEGSK
jgi:hypothetical protein